MQLKNISVDDYILISKSILLLEHLKLKKRKRIGCDECRKRRVKTESCLLLESKMPPIKTDK